jgi:hypothetical protein
MLLRMIRPPRIVIGFVVATAAHAQEAKRPPITGIAYVRIYAKDPAASRRFYTQELRLPETKCRVKACARYQVGKDQYVEVVIATASVIGNSAKGWAGEPLSADAPLKRAGSNEPARAGR